MLSTLPLIAALSLALPLACLPEIDPGDLPPSDTVILLTERLPSLQGGIGETDRELAEMLTPPPERRYVECGVRALPTTTGGWRLDSAEDGELLLTADPSVPPERRPDVDRVLWQAEPEIERRVRLLEQGTVDFVDGLRPEDAARLEDSDYILRRRGYGWLVRVEWNGAGGHPALQDVAVRRALAQAVDIDGWIARQFQMDSGDLLARPAVGEVSPVRCRDHDDSIRRLRYDPAAAGGALEAAGWSDSDGDGVRDRDGAALRLTLGVAAGGEDRVVGGWLAASLRDVGVAVSLVEVGGEPGAGAPEVVDGRLLRQAQDFSRPAAGQAAIYDEQPSLFLYWEDKLVAIHTRIKDAQPDVLSPLGHPELWNIPADRHLRQPDGGLWPVHPG